MSREPNFKSKDLRETIEGCHLLTKPKAGQGKPLLLLLDIGESPDPRSVAYVQATGKCCCLVV